MSSPQRVSGGSGHRVQFPSPASWSLQTKQCLWGECRFQWAPMLCHVLPMLQHMGRTASAEDTLEEPFCSNPPPGPADNISWRPVGSQPPARACCCLTHSSRVPRLLLPPASKTINS